MATTNTSGASINPERQTNNVTILANDYPYGYLQFSDGREPATGDPMILPATQNPTVRTEYQPAAFCNRETVRKCGFGAEGIEIKESTLSSCFSVLNHC